MNQDSFNIDYDGSLILEGLEIYGSIKSDKDIYLKGIVRGDVHSKQSVIVNNEAVINGDLICNELFLDGIVTGNIQVALKAVLGPHAVIKGVLVTTRLQIDPNAMVGRLKLKNASNIK